MKRYDVINLLISKFSLKRYLEIGIFEGECLRSVNCQIKDGVDPTLTSTDMGYPITSDDFFLNWAPLKEKYDIIFIDGDHHSWQVNRDLINSLNNTVDNGIIVLHDCNPPSVLLTTEIHVPGAAWNGDVYRTALGFQKINYGNRYFTVDDDWGIGVILKNRPPEIKLRDEEYNFACYNWDYFDKNRKKLLNIKTPEQFINELKNY